MFKSLVTNYRQRVTDRVIDRDFQQIIKHSITAKYISSEEVLPLSTKTIASAWINVLG